MQKNQHVLAVFLFVFSLFFSILSEAQTISEYASPKASPDLYQSPPPFRCDPSIVVDIDSPGRPITEFRVSEGTNNTVIFARNEWLGINTIYAWDSSVQTVKQVVSDNGRTFSPRNIEIQGLMIGFWFSDYATLTAGVEGVFAGPDQKFGTTDDYREQILTFPFGVYQSNTRFKISNYLGQKYEVAILLEGIVAPDAYVFCSKQTKDFPTAGNWSCGSIQTLPAGYTIDKTRMGFSGAGLGLTTIGSPSGGPAITTRLKDSSGNLSFYKLGADGSFQQYTGLPPVTTTGPVLADANDVYMIFNHSFNGSGTFNDSKFSYHLAPPIGLPLFPYTTKIDNSFALQTTQISHTLPGDGRDRRYVRFHDIPQPNTPDQLYYGEIDTNGGLDREIVAATDITSKSLQNKASVDGESIAYVDSNQDLRYMNCR